VATRLVKGVLREIWDENVFQAGAVLTIPTTVRISHKQLSRVRGLFIVTDYTGTPALAASAAISPAGYLVVTVTNAGGGSTIKWLLDVTLTHSTSQAIDPNPAVIEIFNGAFPSGGGPPPDMAQCR
jgi:hypothetical protein